MAALLIASALLGIGLGMRFKVFALFPAVLLGLPAIAAFMILKTSDWSLISIAAIAGLVCLQIGYFAALIIRSP